MTACVFLWVVCVHGSEATDDVHADGHARAAAALCHGGQLIGVAKGLQHSRPADAVLAFLAQDINRLAPSARLPDVTDEDGFANLLSQSSGFLLV